MLRFDEGKFEIRSLTAGDKTARFRAYEGIVYCERPVDDIQRLNLYVPEAYYRGEGINGYSLKTAPIFVPNTVGGYMPGAAMVPGVNSFDGQPNSALKALLHGYVVCCPGIRGRTSGCEGRRTGRAPALIVDMKAAIRYLRFNRDIIPGDTDRIITNGTSAGGALSALAGATGNSPDYDEYLREIGAADAPDDIFAASCYCPIINLEHADMAYEWLFNKEHTFHRLRFEPENGVPKFVPVTGELTDEQISISDELCAAFPGYLNSLGLHDEAGNPLTLEADGTGSFREYVKRFVIESANRELETRTASTVLSRLAVPESAIEQQDYLIYENGRVIDLNWDGFVSRITRMKAVPAFDSLDLNSPENEVFGTSEIHARHFTEAGLKYGKAGDMADPHQVALVNPMNYTGNCGTARHWRIRHGAFDRDTSLAVPVLLSAALRAAGCDVDFALPWGLPHSGDYDLEDTFRWIDGLHN